MSPQHGGAWTLESSSLAHFPTVTIAWNQTVRDGSNNASALTPIPEQEWLVERDWYIVHHWEDQFCRDTYRDLCKLPEMQHLRAAATSLPGTTPQVWPVDSIVNTSPRGDFVDEIRPESIYPCVWKHVLTHESLAQFASRTDQSFSTF